MVSVTFDTTELDISLREANDRMLRAIRRGFSETMSRVKERTKNHINKHFRNQASQMVGNSLDREIEITHDRVEARFGSRGGRGDGEIGAGIETSPDDNGNTWNLGIMYNEGTPAGYFEWQSGAAVRGRHVYRFGNKRYGWMPSYDGQGYHYGLVGTRFIDEAQRIFEMISERTVKRHIDREFQEVI
tara:strand:+ start:93 stop:653 length:561 start_codon:yes stop_codon:yes gene_type:complete